MIGEYLPHFLLAWSIQWMGVLSPGPSVALILGVATAHGRGPALLTAAGVACGSIVLSVGTVLGVTAIFSQAAELMQIVRWIGAAYLLWLAWNAFRKAINPPPLNLGSDRRGSPLRLALSGFTLQVTNPKAIFFWLAIAGIGGVGDAPWPMIVLFVVGSFLNSFIGHGGYALLLSSPPVRHAYRKARRWIEGGLGSFFLFASYRLAIQRF